MSITPPLPDVDDPDFAPYFAGCRAGELRVQSCASCGRKRWPPRPVCAGCGASEFAWATVAATGRLFSFVVIHASTTPWFAERLPYAVVVVEIDGEPSIRFLGNAVECEPTRLKIGLPMEVVFQQVADGVVLPYWRPQRRPAP